MPSVDFYITQSLLDAWTSQKRFVVAYGGRGSGKSMGAAALCTIHALQNPGHRILCIRGVQNKISESSLQAIKDVISMMNLDSYFTMTENTLKCTNGSEFLFYGAKNYQSFKSLQSINLCWTDESTELSKDAWETLIPTIREPGSRFIITFNPEKETDWCWINFVLSTYPNSIVTKINYLDNDYFPDVLREQMEWDRSTNTAKYEHIWEGGLNITPIGALWTSDMIQLGEAPEYDKIIIAVDPSTTSKSTSDACGIVAVGKAGSDYYVLEDATSIASPLQWASKAIALYNYYQANYIVYESNQGGDMTKTIIQGLDPTIPVKSVWASRGKLIRAEPIVALYEQKKVFHVKRFKDLEYEMCFYVEGSKSPNRLDAMVWGLSSLAIEKKISSAKNMQFRF